MTAVAIAMWRECVRLKVDNARLLERNDSLTADNRRLANALEKQAAEQESRFELLARRIIESQSETMRVAQTRELGRLLDPLREQIDGFRMRVEQCYSEEARERFSLSERIRELVSTNTAIGRKAEELSLALRGNTKAQGDWGEMVLETLLEKSGLRKGVEFETQQTRDNRGNTLRNADGGMLRPDVVVRYPDRGCMVIDSKVSLTAFTEMANAESPERREDAQRRHLQSVTRHIQELAEKHYEEYVGDGAHLDFVMMFIPNEGAYSAALQSDPALWEKAYDRRIIIASPTQLMGALRIVAQMWRHDRQARNAADIAVRSGQMYDKFAGFVDDLLKVERSLDTASATLAEAKKKLCEGKGNLVRRAEVLRSLGAKASRQLSLESDDDQS